MVWDATNIVGLIIAGLFIIALLFLLSAQQNFYARARAKRLFYISILLLVLHALFIISAKVIFDDGNYVGRFLGVSADSHWLKGNYLFEEGRFEEALSEYNRALELDPQHVESYFNKGITLFYLGRYRESLITFETLISIEPNFPEAKWHKGMVESILNQISEENK